MDRLSFPEEEESVEEVESEVENNEVQEDSNETFFFAIFRVLHFCSLVCPPIWSFSIN